LAEAITVRGALAGSTLETDQIFQGQGRCSLWSVPVLVLFARKYFADVEGENIRQH
jgi:hypothetical protein